MPDQVDLAFTVRGPEIYGQDKESGVYLAVFILQSVLGNLVGPREPSFPIHVDLEDLRNCTGSRT